MRKSRVLYVLATLVAAVPILLADEKTSDRASNHVVWAGSTPLFIPSSRLITPDGQIEMSYFQSPGAQRALRRLLEDAKSRPVGQCAPYSLAQTDDTFGYSSKKNLESQSTEPMPEWLSRVRRSAIAARGKVIEVIPGYSWRTNAPANLVRVRVDRVYRQRYGRGIAVGDVVSYVTGSGSLTIDGTVVCMSRPDEPAVQVGQELILSGFPNEGEAIPLDLNVLTDVLPIDRSGMISVRGQDGIQGRRSVGEVEAEVERVTTSDRRLQGRHMSLSSIPSF